MRKSWKMTKVQAVTLIFGCIFLGSIFIFGDRYLNAPVSRDEAIHTSAVFSSYEEVKLRRRSREIIMRFEDHMQLDISGAYLNDKLRKDISDLTTGTEIELILHPNSNVIMEMCVGEDILIDFDESLNILITQTGRFLWPGVICYILSGTVLIMILVKKRQKRYF